jgi:hypothetical protein
MRCVVLRLRATKRDKVKEKAKGGRGGSFVRLPRCWRASADVSDVRVVYRRLGVLLLLMLAGLQLKIKL